MKLVGIFSREHESCYRWLENEIVAWENVRDVRSVTITNNFGKFQEETSKCDFAILYHSKTRGRINVADVNDSLYNEELQHLNTVYGKKNVLVVIDDLDDSSDEEKYRILDHQPSILLLAEDLFLFSSADKAELNILGYQAAHNPQRALEKMRRIIEGDKHQIFPPHTPSHTSHSNADIENLRHGDKICKRPTRLCLGVTIIIIVGLVIILLSVLLSK